MIIFKSVTHQAPIFKELGVLVMTLPFAILPLIILGTTSKYKTTLICIHNCFLFVFSFTFSLLKTKLNYELNDNQCVTS